MPSAISALRIVALPFLIDCLYGGHALLAEVLYVGIILTDVMDGKLARRLHVASEFGARFDVITDFVVICGLTIAFMGLGLYPVWLLLLIFFMFAQFIITSKLKKIVYDPVGKYFGSVLFGGIGLTILCPQQLVCEIIFLTVVVVAALSIASRVMFLLKSKVSMAPIIPVGPSKRSYVT